MDPVCTVCTGALPVITNDRCAPEMNLSEITDIYIGKAISAPFEDVSDVAEWTPRLSNSSVTGNDYIRHIMVIADKPAPTSTPRPISGYRIYIGVKTHVLNITIDDTNSTLYNFLINLECGSQYRVWYKTASGHLYGGNEGLLGNFALDNILARGQEELEVIAGTFTWKRKFTEERVLSPV